MVDALSRQDEEMELQLVSRPFWQDISVIDEEVKADPTLAKIIEDLKLALSLILNIPWKMKGCITKEGWC